MAISNIIYNKLYNVWRSMNRRCNSPNDNNYKKYGAKGIRVCKEWLRDCDGGFCGFENFKNWAIANGYEIGLTIDRINPYDGYFPQNCRWVNYHKQNARLTIRDNASSGYIGINLDKRRNKWRSRIRMYGKEINLGYYENKKEAVDARNNYIIQNHLEYPIQKWIGEEGYKKETYESVYK